MLNLTDEQKRMISIKENEQRLPPGSLLRDFTQLRQKAEQSFAKGQRYNFTNYDIMLESDYNSITGQELVPGSWYTEHRQAELARQRGENKNIVKAANPPLTPTGGNSSALLQTQERATPTPMNIKPRPLAGPSVSNSNQSQLSQTGAISQASNAPANTGQKPVIAKNKPAGEQKSFDIRLTGFWLQNLDLLEKLGYFNITHYNPGQYKIPAEYARLDDYQKQVFARAVELQRKIIQYERNGSDLYRRQIPHFEKELNSLQWNGELQTTIPRYLADYAKAVASAIEKENTTTGRDVTGLDAMVALAGLGGLSGMDGAFKLEDARGCRQ